MYRKHGFYSLAELDLFYKNISSNLNMCLKVFFSVCSDVFFNILPKQVAVIWMYLHISSYVCMFVCAYMLQPWESQLFCSTFPYEIVCSDSWGQSLLAATDAAGVMLLDGEVIPNQYLPMSSKIKPPIHIHSILRSAECQGQQLTWCW